MYVFFTVAGAVFIALFATITNFIYDLFPINKITNFFKPRNDGIWSNINSTMLPIILWGFIEVSVIGDKSLFFLAIILNVFVSSAVIYIIKYTIFVIFKVQNNIINLFSIYFATLIGQTLVYMLLIISKTTKNLYISIIGLGAFLLFYLMLTLFPPKTEFFIGTEKK